MKKNFVDCFMLMGTALSLKGGERLPEMGRPLLQDVFATVVNVSLTVQEFHISEHKNLEVDISALLNQRWVDPRLGSNVRTRKMAVAGQIWKPKIVNLNGRSELCNNENTIFWRGFGDEGHVLLSEQLKLRTSCTRNYLRFPFDTQICEIKFGSYRFPEEEVSISWHLNPVEITTRLNLNEFDIVNVTTLLEIDVRSSGNFSVAVVHFILKRNYSHYLYCIVLPCVLLTLLNYVSLWFDLNKRSTRLYLNMITFALMLYFYYISICSTLITSYLKALDIFVAVSMCFSLFTLLETLFIDNMCNVEELQFHLKKTASSKEYPKLVYWSELALKLSYPMFYIFFLILYAILFIE